MLPRPIRRRGSEGWRRWGFQVLRRLHSELAPELNLVRRAAIPRVLSLIVFQADKWVLSGLVVKDGAACTRVKTQGLHPRKGCCTYQTNRW